MFWGIAFYVRLSSNSSIGAMLPISGFVIACGLILCFYLWRLSQNSRNVHKSMEKWQGVLDTPKITSIASVLMIEVILTILVILIYLNLRLFGKAYIGIFPALFLIFAFTLALFILLNLHVPSFSHFSYKLIHITIQDWFLLIAIWVGSGIGGYNFSQKLLPSISFLNKFIENKLVFWLIASFTIIVFFDLSLLLLSFFHWRKTSYSQSRKMANSGFLFLGKKIKSHPALFAFFLTLIFMVGFLFFFHAGYDTSDDILMIQIMSGYIGGVPQQFSVNSNVLLGLLFQKLFSLNTGINWVTCFYLLINFLSLWTLIHSLIKSQQRAIFQFFGIVLVLLYDSYYLSNLTYTSIAALAVIAGLCALVSTICSRENKISLQSFFAIGLITAGSLIRLESFLMVLLLFSPFILINLKKFITKRALFALLVTGCLIISAFYFNVSYVKNNSAWNTYYSYIDVNHQLRDTPRRFFVEKEASLLPSIDWSKNDSFLFNYWLSLDKGVYSESKMLTLSNHISNWNNDLGSVFDIFTQSIFGFPILDFLYLFLATWLIVILSTRNKRVLFTSFLSTLLFTGISWILDWGYKFPTRVSIPLLMTVSLVTLFLPQWFEAKTNEQNEKLENMVFFRGGILLVLLLIFASRGLISRPFEDKKVNESRQAVYSSYLSKIDELIGNGTLDCKSLILAPNAGFPFYYMNPLTLEEPGVDMLTGGWNSFSPAYEMSLSRHGIIDGPQSFVDKSDFYLLSQSSLIPYIKIFYLEHYGMNVNSKEIFTFNQPDGSTLEENPLILYQLYTVHN